MGSHVSTARNSLELWGSCRFSAGLDTSLSCGWKLAQADVGDGGDRNVNRGLGSIVDCDSNVDCRGCGENGGDGWNAGILGAAGWSGELQSVKERRLTMKG
jgi:hypothetical protein